jgi:hypothetical protein
MMMEGRVVTDDEAVSLLSLDDVELEDLVMLDELFDADLCPTWSNQDLDSAPPVASPVPPSPTSWPPLNCGAAERPPGDPAQGQGLHDHGRPEQARTPCSNVRLHDGQGRPEQAGTAYSNAPAGLGPETPGPETDLLLPTGDVDDSMDAKSKEEKRGSVRLVTRVSSGSSLRC